MFKNAYWPYYPKFCKELEAKILEVRLAEAFVEEKDVTDEMWADIKYFITDNIEFITKNVRVDEDKNVHQEQGSSSRIWYQLSGGSV